MHKSSFGGKMKKDKRKEENKKVKMKEKKTLEKEGRPEK